MQNHNVIEFQDGWIRLFAVEYTWVPPIHCRLMNLNGHRIHNQRNNSNNIYYKTKETVWLHTMFQKYTFRKQYGLLT